MNDVIAEIRKDYIYNLAKRKERVDGRAFDEYRPISVEMGLIDKAEGSARVKIGNTQVMVGIKIQPGDPFPDAPDMGVIITNVELVPLASPSFEPGPPDENAIELARVVDRGVRESGAIDLSTLNLPDGKVWLVFIDVHVLDHDGNLMDAAALGARRHSSTLRLRQKNMVMATINRYRSGSIPSELRQSILVGK